jgi:hypothetical protein
MCVILILVLMTYIRVTKIKCFTSYYKDQFKYKQIFEDLKNVNTLQYSEVWLIGKVCKFIQAIEMGTKITNRQKHVFITIIII